MDQVLAQLSESVASAHTLEELTRPMLDMLEKITGLESTYLTTIDLEKGLQHILFSRNAKSLNIPEGLSVPWADTLCRRALEEARPFTNEVDTCWGDSEAARALGIQTYVSTPIHTAEGNLYGTLCAASSSRLPLPSNASHVLQLFASLIGQHVQREMLLVQLKKANAELTAYASTDALTGLPNRRALTAELRRLLAQAQRQRGALLVAFIDLDGFKAINDVHGHEAGDEFLCALSRKMLESLRSSDFIARLGGDEFVVLGPGPEPGGDGGAPVAAFKERLEEATVGKVVLSGVEIHYPGASVGVVAVDPTQTSAEQALKQADAAMYEEKQRRKGARAMRSPASH